MVNRSPVLTWLKKVYAVQVCNVNTSNRSKTIQNNIAKKPALQVILLHPS